MDAVTCIDRRAVNTEAKKEGVPTQYTHADAQAHGRLHRDIDLARPIQGIPAPKHPVAG